MDNLDITRLVATLKALDQSMLRDIMQLIPLQVEGDEAATLLRFGRSTIYDMINTGELPSTRRGAARRIPYAALLQWIAKHSEG